MSWDSCSFFLTFVLKRTRSPADCRYFPARALEWGTREARGCAGARFVSGFMLAMTGVCALVSFLCLLDLGYLVYHGGTSISWNFFTKLPAPVGEKLAAAWPTPLLASGKLLLLAATHRRSCLFLFGAIYLAEFSGSTTPSSFAIAAGLLNGVPSDCHRHFAYSLVGLALQAFLHTVPADSR